MDELLIIIETKLAEAIDFIAAVAIGLTGASGYWLWVQNVETVTISSLLSGLSNCF